MTAETETAAEFGRARLRKEGERLITGQTNWTDNIRLPGMLHVAYLRTPYAHARITSVNVSVARTEPGVIPMGSVPVRASAAEGAAAGADASRDALGAAAAHADEGTNPPADLHGAPDYLRHLARVLTGRALAAAAGI